MQKTRFKAEERGRGEHEWLSTRFSFSFADWYDPSRMGFGALRVLNDDRIAPLGKFGMHPHENFEIVTIPLRGAVTHEDNLGNVGTVGPDEVQALSAGSGVVHSEGNASETEPLELFQIWITPNVWGAAPRYSQARYAAEDRKNKWQVLASGDGAPGSVPLYQEARIARADLAAEAALSYTPAFPGNGIFLMVITGEVACCDEVLTARDALSVSDVSTVSVTTAVGASVLLIEVPVGT